MRLFLGKCLTLKVIIVYCSFVCTHVAMFVCACILHRLQCQIRTFKLKPFENFCHNRLLSGKIM